MCSVHFYGFRIVYSIHVQGALTHLIKLQWDTSFNICAAALRPWLSATVSTSATQLAETEDREGGQENKGVY